ncbi:MAG: alkylphosphonate utilization protein, partial [Rhodomicrobium sp.]
MSTLPACPKCSSAYTYEDNGLLTCPECAHEWHAEASTTQEAGRIYRDSAGNILQ